MNSAIPFIIVNQGFKFSICEESKLLLENEDNEFSIVTISGPSRSGKSFLLNALLGNDKIFQVDPTTNSCTKGLWIYRSQINNKIIYFIDSEGFGGTDKTRDFDSKLLTLCSLISTIIIYNSLSTIDENAIQNLAVVTELGKMIKIRSSSELNEDISTLFPTFVWILRDFHLELMDNNNRSISPDEYLEDALKIQEGFSKEILFRNKIRMLITSFFKERHCVTLSRPADNEEDLKKLNDLKPQFKEELDNIRQLILSLSKDKTINGNKIKGKSFLLLCESIIEAFNSNRIPAILDAWDEILRIQMEKEFNNIISIFIKEINLVNVEDPKILKEIYKKVMRELILNFSKKCNPSEKLVMDLKSKMKSLFLKQKQKIESFIDEKEKVFLYNEFDKILGLQFTDPREIINNFYSILQTFLNSSKSLNKHQIANELIMTKINFISQMQENVINSKFAVDASKKEISFKQELNELEVKYQGHLEANNLQIEKLNSKLIEEKENRNQLALKIEALKQRIEEKDKELKNITTEKFKSPKKEKYTLNVIEEMKEKDMMIDKLKEELENYKEQLKVKENELKSIEDKLIDTATRNSQLISAHNQNRTSMKMEKEESNLPYCNSKKLFYLLAILI